MKFPIQRFTVFGDSMLPTLKRGDNVLVLCWLFKINPSPLQAVGYPKGTSLFRWREIEKGDLVAVKKEGREMIKRIKAVKEDQVFILGDNEKVSLDSRSFGWVSKKEIIGKIIWHQG